MPGNDFLQGERPPTCLNSFSSGSVSNNVYFVSFVVVEVSVLGGECRAHSHQVSIIAELSDFIICAGRAIVLVRVLFAFFHLTLSGLAPRLPLAFALGYVVWRSNSLLPGIALHLANNALGGLLLLGIGLRPEAVNSLPVGSASAAGAGLLLALLALWAFRRSTTAPAPHPLLASSLARGRLARTWPLLLALLIWLGVAGLELAMGRARDRGQ